MTAKRPAGERAATTKQVQAKPMRRPATRVRSRGDDSDNSDAIPDLDARENRIRAARKPAGPQRPAPEPVESAVRARGDSADLDQTLFLSDIPPTEPTVHAAAGS